MPDYAFYTDAYLGEDIPEADFPRYAKRAAAKLAHYNQVFRVSPREGIPDAEDNALCAIADAMYEFDAEDSRRGLASASVGSVSETYVAPAELSATTLYLREAYFRQVAGDFLLMRRGVRHG
ncbi:hypothetical protein [uncultured Gemmiger sp.]|uniref:hypothetical protein n=1 Tax=uncultured Gemmiger sp. TaxID=1623490 RepID=UPI0025E73F1A|nr:hypothetical protein [uncultured Gemmiger sp.]